MQICIENDISNIKIDLFYKYIVFPYRKNNISNIETQSLLRTNIIFVPKKIFLNHFLVPKNAIF